MSIIKINWSIRKDQSSMFSSSEISVTTCSSSLPDGTALTIERDRWRFKSPPGSSVGEAARFKLPFSSIVGTVRGDFEEERGVISFELVF